MKSMNVALEGKSHGFLGEVIPVELFCSWVFLSSPFPLLWKAGPSAG